MRTGVVVVAVAVAVWMVAGAACTSDGHDETTPRRPVPEAKTSPPGAPLAEGFVVPRGARLVGAVFPRPDPTPASRKTVAVLLVNDNPFAVWDDLADQAHELGMPLPHSGICKWSIPYTDPGTSTEPVPVADPRPPDANAVDCESAAWAGTTSILARLWQWAKGAELHLEISGGGGAARPAASASDPNPDPGPAPARAAGEVPALTLHEEPSVGEPFGFASNCPEEDIALQVPLRSRVVGGGTTPGLEDFAAVLAVADPHAALKALGRQLDPTGPDVGLESVHIERTTIPHTGQPVWRLTASRDAGGGACEMWSSPDGNTILVTTHSD